MPDMVSNGGIGEDCCPKTLLTRPAIPPKPRASMACGNQNGPMKPVQPDENVSQRLPDNSTFANVQPTPNLSNERDEDANTCSLLSIAIDRVSRHHCSHDLITTGSNSGTDDWCHVVSLNISKLNQENLRISSALCKSTVEHSEHTTMPTIVNTCPM